MFYLLLLVLQDDFDLCMDFSKTKKKNKKKKDIDELVAEEMDKKGDLFDEIKHFPLFHLIRLIILYIMILLTMASGILSPVKVLLRLKLLCRELFYLI